MHDRWTRFNAYLVENQDLGMALDVSQVNFPPGYLEVMERPMSAAFDQMHDIEAGAIANPDEDRMVGHYWLRAPDLAPAPEIRDAISSTVANIERFAADVHSGRVAPVSGDRFTHLLMIGIGGSALGPQLVADALGTADAPLSIHFIDNTDPDGMDRVFDAIGPDLARTLIVVVSKSGGTRETRNGMLEARQWCARSGLTFARQAVAVTGTGSALHRLATSEAWLASFPMWDWVGGRTSVTGPVGLLPAALQRIDIQAFLEGARQMDRHTRVPDLRRNPAAMLSAMWYHCTAGRGAKDMVILPYKDRLSLFSRYLQQLVMESLGKALDLQGRPVHQGLTVYGNKGSTDQHAYVQQLREGVHNFFVTFIHVLEDRSHHGLETLEVEEGVTSGDYLTGFHLGTRRALLEAGRDTITITLRRVDARSLGALIALFERAVGLYAHLAGINAYHQPGVEAGKRAAGRVVAIQKRLLSLLRQGTSGTVEELAGSIGSPDEAETVYHVLEHLCANGRARVVKDGLPAGKVYGAREASSGGAA